VEHASRAFRASQSEYTEAARSTSGARYDGDEDREDRLALSCGGVLSASTSILTKDTFAARRTRGNAHRRSARAKRANSLKQDGRARVVDYSAAAHSVAGASLGQRGAHSRLDGRHDAHSDVDCALVTFLSADADSRRRGDSRVRRHALRGCCARAQRSGSTVRSLELSRRDHASRAGSRTREGPTTRSQAWAVTPKPPDEPCDRTSSAVCRGGCKIVARQIDGAHGRNSRVPSLTRASQGRRRRVGREEVIAYDGRPVRARPLRDVSSWARLRRDALDGPSQQRRIRREARTRREG